MGTLMEEKLTLEQILDASNNGVIAVDRGGAIVFANAQVQRFFGLDPGKITGVNLMEALPGAAPVVMESLRTGEARLSCLIHGKQGNLVLSIGLIRENHEITGAVCSFQRVEQMELSAQEFESYKNLNRQLNAIFHSSSDGIWVCDGQGNVIDINEASEKLNSIKAADVVGKNVRDIVASGLFDRSVTLEVLETRRQVSAVQNIKRTGKLLLATGTPVFDEAGNIFMVVVNELDMTQLNEIREQLEQSRMVTEKYREELAELSVLELKEQEIIAENASMRQVLAVALKLAHLEASNILILGESGTGKGLLAKFIHKNGKRSTKPFIQINCAALPESLLEAELFGYEKGAFTGAREQGKAGLFELAHEGTLFLDEIGDLPLTVQAKLLKYLDDQEIMRLGSLKPRKIDCIVIAATNQDLEGLTKAKLFRQDLFYRLNTFTFRIPSLRERVEDIFELANYFLRKYNRNYRVRRRISSHGLGALQSYAFPGNVRELKSLLKQAVIMSDQELLDDFIISSLGEGSEATGRRPPGRQSLKSLNEGIVQAEREILEQALRKYKSTRQLARHLGISQPTVVRKLKKYGLSAHRVKSKSY
jgi:TyrR family helix-turn-helix protein/PAS domain S-box-containing protein